MQAFELSTPLGTIRAKRLLLAAGAWLKPLAALLAMDLPVNARANIVSVTERMPPLTSSVIGHATGLLTTKQKANGTVLIGGGWQGRGTPKTGRGEVDAASVRPNPALAHYTVPALGAAHVLRSWTGFEANVPDFYPLAGALPGVPEAYVLGCVRDGDTIGPYIGQLMGDFILGREPEMPLFDPVRDVLFARSGQDHVSAKIWVHHQYVVTDGHSGVSDALCLCGVQVCADGDHGNDGPRIGPGWCARQRLNAKCSIRCEYGPYSGPSRKS